MDDLIARAVARILATAPEWAVTAAEQVTATPGTPMTLQHEFIYADSVSVTDETGASMYTVDEDYTLEAETGTLTVLAGGAIADGQLLLVTYAYAAVYPEPPESLPDTPAAVVLETDGEAARAGYRGLWENRVTVRVAVYAAPRTHLPAAVRLARPWVARLLDLVGRHDELAASETDEPLGELLGVSWTVGMLEYARTMYAAVDLRITYRVDWQVVATCGLIDDPLEEV